MKITKPLSEMTVLFRKISLAHNNAPIMFTARSPKSIRSIVVRMAVAESALRRGILGVKFIKVLALKEE